MSERKINKVVVVGAGGVGWWLVNALMRDTKGARVEVWDDDTFEEGFGAARLPWQENLQQTKVRALEGWVEMAMGDMAPATYETRFHGDVWTGDPTETLVVDCTDAPPSERREIWEACRNAGATMLRVSYDGNGVIVIARGLPLSDRPGGGYTRIPSLAQAQAAGGLGAMAVHLLLEGKEVQEIAVQLPVAEEVQDVQA